MLLSMEYLKQSLVNSDLLQQPIITKFMNRNFLTYAHSGESFGHNAVFFPNLPPLDPQQALCKAVLPPTSCLSKLMSYEFTNISTTSTLPFQQALLRADLPSFVGTSTLHPFSIKYLRMLTSPFDAAT